MPYPRPVSSLIANKRGVVGVNSPEIAVSYILPVRRRSAGGMDNGNQKNLSELVEETIRTLYDKGIAPADLAPLVKLRDALAPPNGQSPSPGIGTLETYDSPTTFPAPEMTGDAPAPIHGIMEPGQNSAPEVTMSYDRDGRLGEMKASETLMARASAIIDVLIQSGQSPELSAQTVTRQLLSVGIQLPESGGDVRAWKRLLNWRNNLIHYKRTGSAWDVYCAFKEELAVIPADKRVQVAVGERLWDQRKTYFSSQSIA